MRIIETPQEVEQLFYLRDGRTLVSFGQTPKPPPPGKVTKGRLQTLDSVQGWDVTTGAESFVLTHRPEGTEAYRTASSRDREVVAERAILSPSGTFLALDHSFHSRPTFEIPKTGGILLWRIPSNPSGEKDLTQVGCFCVSANWKQQPRHLPVCIPFALSADEHLFASGTGDVWTVTPEGSYISRIQVCRLHDNWLTGRLIRQSEVRSLCFSPDSQELYLASAEPGTPPQVEFWSITPLEMIRRVEVPSTGQLKKLLVTPDGNTLIVHTSTRVLLLNRKTGTIRNWLEAGPGETIPSVAISPDGNRLLLCIGKTVRLLDVPNLRLREAFDWKIRDLRAVAFSPDGMTMAAAGPRRIVVWDSPP